MIWYTRMKRGDQLPFDQFPQWSNIVLKHVYFYLDIHEREKGKIEIPPKRRANASLSGSLREITWHVGDKTASILDAASLSVRFMVD